MKIKLIFLLLTVLAMPSMAAEIFTPAQLIETRFTPYPYDSTYGFTCARSYCDDSASPPYISSATHQHFGAGCDYTDNTGQAFQYNVLGHYAKATSIKQQWVSGVLTNVSRGAGTIAIKKPIVIWPLPVNTATRIVIPAKNYSSPSPQNWRMGTGIFQLNAKADTTTSLQLTSSYNEAGSNEWFEWPRSSYLKVTKGAKSYTLRCLRPY